MRRSLSAFVVALLFWFSSNTGVADRPPQVLRVGVVPQFETQKLHQIWQPILQQLSALSGLQFEFVPAPTIPDFEQEFQLGNYELAYLNPYHFLMAQKAQGYIPLVRDHARSLKGVLVVRRDSGIETVQQLKDQKIAFPAPNALGASLQMRQELNDLFHLNFTPVYARSHDSVYLNVLLGQTAAGGGVQKTLSRQKPEIQDALKVIYSTTPVAPHPVVLHPRVKHYAETLQKAFLSLSQSAEGKKLLSKIPMPEVGLAKPEDYAPLLSMRLDRFFEGQQP